MDIREKRERPQFRMAYRLDDAAHLASVSRTALYNDIKAKKLRVVKRNRSTRVLHDDLLAYVKTFKPPG